VAAGPPAKRSFDRRSLRVANEGYLREIDKPGTDSGKQELEAGQEKNKTAGPDRFFRPAALNLQPSCYI